MLALVATGTFIMTGCEEWSMPGKATTADEREIESKIIPEIMAGTNHAEVSRIDHDRQYSGFMYVYLESDMTRVGPTIAQDRIELPDGVEIGWVTMYPKRAELCVQVSGVNKLAGGW